MRIVTTIVFIILALAGVRWFIGFTPPIFSKNAIASLETVEINGDKQYLLIRGVDRENPVLLFLHGGPGMPAMYLGHAFQRPLEEEFVVVQWDQRASGKSYSNGADPTTITTSQLIADAKTVIEHLQNKLGADQVYLVGHSHGSYLGAILANKRPDLIKAYIGVGQVADEAAAIPLQDSFLRSRLGDLGMPANTPITNANREDLLFKTGAEIFGATSFIPLIFAGLLAPEYSLSDVMSVQKGSSFSSKHMRRDMLHGALMTELTNFEVPVHLVMGAYDMVTPTSLAHEYYKQIQAPAKTWSVFAQSAHFPFWEEPENFARTMRQIKNRD